MQHMLDDYKSLQIYQYKIISQADDPVDND